MRTFDKPTKIFVPVFLSNKNEDWVKGSVPLVLETKVTEASFQNAKKRLEKKEGLKAILELGPVTEDDCDFLMPLFLMTESDLTKAKGNTIVWEREGGVHPYIWDAMGGKEVCSYGRMKVLQVKRVIQL